ncbi:MAG TPA: hypothetical protein VNM37_23980, partial [Candidatus Dormibacteraeota bacterium]|nr:hypothetical protein [Candidatus Dormibacteraeota bacterium]
MKPRRILFASLAFSWFGLILAAPAAVLPPEKLLPTDTVLVVTVPDYAKSKAVWQQSPSSRLLEDPSLKAFKDKLVGKLQSDLIAPLEKQLGITVADYAGLAQGQLTLALTPNDWEGNNPGPPGVLMLMDARDKSGVLKSNLATLKTKWVDSGKQVRVEKIRDVE